MSNEDLQRLGGVDQGVEGAGTDDAVVESGAAEAVGQAQAPQILTRPAPGDTLVITDPAGQAFVLDFDPAAAQVLLDGDDLVLGFDDNGDGVPDSRIVFENLASDAAAEGTSFQVAGIDIAAGVLVNQALALADTADSTLETAAGAPAIGGGATEYVDNLGSIIDLLVAQGVIPPTALEFGLIGLDDDPTILDEAEGTLSLTFLTETDGGEGSVNTFEGGFEDWQPNQDDCEGETFPMEVIIGFTPADNEELVSLTLSGIPEGAVLYVGGTADTNIVDTSGGSSPLLSTADLASGLFLLPPPDSGDDIPLTVTATIVDPDSGLTAEISGSATAIIDSVADNPEFLLDGDEDYEPEYFIDQRDYSGGEGGGHEGDDCKVPSATLTYEEDNGVPVGGDLIVSGDSQGGGEQGEPDCYDDRAPIFGAGFVAAVTDVDGSESLTTLTVATTTEDEPLGDDPEGLEVALSDVDDPTATNFMIGEQVLVHGDTVEVSAIFADGSEGPATATIEIVDGVLTLSFDPALRVQSADLSSGSETPFQVRLPQHSDDDFQLNLEVTAVEFDIDGELTLENNVATHQAVLNVEVKAIADGAELTVSVDGAPFAEDDEVDPAKHGDDAGETPLMIPLSSLGAALVDRDGSEAITEIKLSLDGADDGAMFVDAVGNPLGATLEIPAGDGTVTADVSIVDQMLTLTFDGGDTAGLDLDLSGLIQVKLPVDDSSDFTVNVAATTTEVNPEGDVTLESKTTESSFDVQVQGVAGPAAVTFGDYSNVPGCPLACSDEETPQDAGNSLTLKLFEDGAGSVEGQDGAGPLSVPVLFSAVTQDSDGSEGITKITFSLDGAAEGTAFVDGLGDPLADGDTVSGGTVSFDDDQLVLTFADPGPQSVDVSGLFVQVPQDSDDDFAIGIQTTTTEYDDDGFGALVETFVTDAVINVVLDAVADPVTVSVDAVSGSGDEAFAPGETGTVTVNATFGDFTDGSEVHTVTVTVPFGFTVTDLAGGTLDGDTISWTVSGGTFEAVLGVVANEDLTVDEEVVWEAEAKAVEQNENTDHDAGDAECTTDNNEAVATAEDAVTLDPALPPEVSVSLQGEPLCIKEDGSGQFTVTVSAQNGSDDFVSEILVGNLPGVPEGWTSSVVGSDGGSFNPATGLYTTNGSPASVVLTVSLTPPADSDLDVLTTMGADISFTATAEDPESGDTATADPVEADVDVDAVADDVTVGIDAESASGDEAFAPGETGTVTVDATFGDFTDGSETHTVTVEVPSGFTVTDLDGGTLNGSTISWVVSGSPFQAVLQVVADDPLLVEQPVTWSAEAKAVETNTPAPDAEKDESDNEQTAQAEDEVTLDPALPPEVSVSLQGEPLCIKEDGSGQFTVTVSAQNGSDDFVSEILVGNLPGVPEGWTSSVVGSDGGSFNPATGLYTTNGSPASVVLTVSLTPPADSDLDVLTTMGADISFTATAEDPESGDTATADPVEADVDVDAVADDVTVGIDAESASGDEAFAPGETGTVTVDATFGDFTDGSETHTVTVEVPSGFTVTDLDGGTLNGSTISWVVSGSPFQAVLQVVADDPLLVEQPVTWSAEAKAVETNTPAPDAEKDESDNEQTAQAEDEVTLDPALPPEVSVSLQGQPLCIKEDGEGQFTVTVTAQGDDVVDTVSFVQFQALQAAGWGVVVNDNGAGGSFAADFGYTADGVDQSVVFTVTLTPPANSDVDVFGTLGSDLSVSATARDPNSGDTAPATPVVIDVDVDAIVDGSEVTQTGAASGDEDTTIDLNLAIALGGDSTTGVGDLDQPATQGGTDNADGSESITEVVVTLSTGELGWVLAGPIGAPVQNPAGTWTFDTAGASEADVQSVVDSLTVTPPTGFDGNIDVTVVTTTAEAATEAGPNGASGEECDESDNVDVDTYQFTVTVDPTTEPPETELGVAVGDCLQEDTQGALAFSATPEGDDAITEIVIGGFPVGAGAWSVDAGSVSLTGLTSPGDFTAAYDAVTGVLTVTISNPPAGAVTGTVNVTPNLNSDVDADLTIQATATDGSSSSTSTPAPATIPVDAIVDGSEVTQTGAASGDEDTTIDLNLAIALGGDSTTGVGDLDQPATQGGTDNADGSESITEVVVTLSTGELGWVLAGPIGAPVQNPAGTWTFDTAGASEADVQSVVDSLTVTPPTGFDGNIDVTVVTTTAEAATEAGPNGASGEECDESDNVDVDTYQFTVTVNDSTPVVVAAEDSLLDEDDLVPDGSDQTPEPGGDRVDTGEIDVDFNNDLPADLTAAFSFTGGSPANGPNGETITYTPSVDGQSLTASIDGTDIFTVVITGATPGIGGEVTYGYEVTLLDEMDHLTGPNGENDFDFTAQFTVTDNDGDPVNGDFDVTVVDDVPEANDDCVEAIAETSARPQNIGVVIDRSGSIDSTEYAQEIAAVRSFIQALIDQGNLGNLAFSIAAFNADGESFGTFVYDGDGDTLADFVEIGGSSNLDSVLTTTGIPNTGGSTDFNAGLAELFGNPNYLSNPVTALPGHADRIFFLSDGNVNNGGTTIAGANETNITDNDVSVVPVAIGDGVTEQNFVDFFGTSIVPDTGAVLTATDFNDLAATLIDSLVSDAVALGNLLDNDVAGADGFGAPEAITQIEHDGVVYTDGTDGSDDGLITITTAGGGTLIVNLETGDFDYSIDPEGATSSEETFDYTVVDGDGDTASATLKVKLDTLPEAGAGDTLTVDETAGFVNEGASDISDDVDPATVTLNAPTQAALGTLGVASDLTDALSVAQQGALAFSYGLNAKGATGGIAFDDPAAADSGLVDTATGQSIFLFLEDGLVVGRVGSGGLADAGGEIAFVLILEENGAPDENTTDSTAEVLVATYRAVEHDDPTDADEANPEAGQDERVTVSFTVTDGDGDTDSANVTVSFEDDGPTAALAVIGSPMIVLDETDNDADDGDVGGLLASKTVFGSTLFSETSDFGADGAADSGSLVYSLDLNPGDSGLVDTLSGEAVALSLEGGEIVGRTENGLDEVFRISIDPSSGDVTVTQSRAVEHDNPGDPDEAASPEVLAGGLVQATVTATDGDGDSDSASVELGALIKFEDDGPAAADDVAEVTENNPVSFDLMFILDTSGSMDESSGISGQSRLQAAGESLKQLIDAYFLISNDVSIQLVTFATNAATVPGTFTDAAAAKAAVDAIVAAGGDGFTNYADALSTAQANYSPGAPAPDAINTVYFLSDGAPTTPPDGDSDSLTSGEVAAWESFLASEGAEAIAVGVGTGISGADDDLEDVAFPRDPVIVNDFADLADALLATVPEPNAVSGNVLEGADSVPDTDDAGEDDAGSDGFGTPPVTQFIHDGNVYNPNTAVNGLVLSNSGGVIVIMTALGGRFEFDFNTGDYTYTAPEVASDDSEAFLYTVQDGDGDTATATLTVSVNDNAAPVASADKVLTNIVDGSDIFIPATALLANDSDANGDPVSIFSVQDPLPAGSSVVLSTGSTTAIGDAPDSVVFARNASGDFSGSFDYTASDGQQLSGFAEVTVDANAGSTITGTGADEILIAGGENDSLDGGGGDDFLVGGAGFDTMTGGAGSDTFHWSVDDLTTQLSGVVVLSTTSNATIGGQFFENDDLVEYDLSADSGSVFLNDASVFENEDNNIDAVHVLGDGRIVLSTSSSAEYDVVGPDPTFSDGDLVLYDPVADTATIFLDEDLFSNNADIDALHLLGNGNYILSTTDSETLGGLSFRDGDLVEYNPFTDTATLFFNEDLFTGNEDINAVHILDNGHIVLSTTNDASLGGLSFENGDLVEYDPIAGTASLFLDEDLFSSGENVDAAHVLVEPDNNVETITDFETTLISGGTDDVLDLTDLLSGLGFDATTDDINDWLTLVDEGADTTVNVDLDGAGGSSGSIDLVMLQGVDLVDAGITVDQLVANGNIDVPES